MNTCISDSISLVEDANGIVDHTQNGSSSKTSSTVAECDKMLLLDQLNADESTTVSSDEEDDDDDNDDVDGNARFDQPAQIMTNNTTAYNGDYSIHSSNS